MGYVGMLQFGKINTDIRIYDVIKKYNFKSLDEIRQRSGIPSDVFESKDELALLISKNIEKGYNKKIPCLDYKRYSILKGVAEGGDADDLCDPRSLFSFMICDMAIATESKWEKSFVLSRELLDIFMNMDSVELAETAVRNTELYDLINGCMVSYGLIGFNEFKEIVEIHIDYDIGDNDFQEAVDGCELVHGMVMTSGNQIVTRMMKPKRLQYFIDEQDKVKDFDYKRFSKEELVHAADLEYVPDTKSYRKLMGILRNHFGCDEKLCRVSAAILINYAKACRDMDDAMAYIVPELGNVTPKFMGDFIPMYCEYNNCTPKWALKGHTPNEITKIKNPELFRMMENANADMTESTTVMPFIN